MKLLNTLLLLVKPSPPTTGVAPGAVYYDSGANEPRYSDGTNWNSFGSNGFPEDVTTTYVVPDNRQVIYFDRFQNDGILTITGTGTLVGMR
jgi:hypothetical protein